MSNRQDRRASSSRSFHDAEGSDAPTSAGRYEDGRREKRGLSPERDHASARHGRDERSSRRGTRRDEGLPSPSSASRKRSRWEESEEDTKRSKERQYERERDRQPSSRGLRSPERKSRLRDGGPDFDRRDHKRLSSQESLTNRKGPSNQNRVEEPQISHASTGPGPQTDGSAEDNDEDAPNFQPSGLLAAESNQKNGVALKYHEPPEARKPKRPWRMYTFKDGKEQEMIVLGAQSAYLFGRDRTVVDIPLDHASCSKQHAVIQFRQTVEVNEFGDRKKRIRPFLIDLESANGCEVNDKEVPPSRYYEIKNGDTLRFGASSREYVMLDEGAV